MIGFGKLLGLYLYILNTQIEARRKSLLIELFQREDRFYTSESDVCKRQILTYRDDPRTERISAGGRLVK